MFSFDFPPSSGRGNILGNDFHLWVIGLEIIDNSSLGIWSSSVEFVSVSLHLSWLASLQNFFKPSLNFFTFSLNISALSSTRMDGTTSPENRLPVSILLRVVPSLYKQAWPIVDLLWSSLGLVDTRLPAGGCGLTLSLIFWEDLHLRKPALSLPVLMFGLPRERSFKITRLSSALDDVAMPARTSLFRRLNTGLGNVELVGEDGGVRETLPQLAWRLGRISLFFSLSHFAISFLCWISRLASFMLSCVFSLLFMIKLLVTILSFLAPVLPCLAIAASILRQFSSKLSN